jgi:predicted metal-dependent RNase
VRNRLRLKNEAKPTQPNRKKTLQEVLSPPDDDGGLVTSIFAAIPISALDREQSLTLVLNEVRKMSEKMNIAVTCVGFGDDLGG